MTIATELQAYNDGLLDAYDAVNAKGGTIPANKNLDNLPTAIGTISGGGGGDRPANWLKMPTDENVADNEFYLLLEMPKTRTEDYKGKMSLDASARYDMEFGTTVNGVFVADPTYSVMNCSKGSYNFTNFAIPMSIFHDTGDTKQVVMRIKTSGNITSFDISRFGKAALGKRAVEIKGRATSMTSLSVGSTSDGYSASTLRYFTLLGTNQISTFNYCFARCYSLESAELDTSNNTSCYGMFQNCSSLTIAPQVDTSSSTRVDSMFYSCSSLTIVPQLNTSSATDLTSMFEGCNSLTEIDLAGYDFSSSTGMANFLKNAYLDGGGNIYLPNKDKFPASGAGGVGVFNIAEDNSNPINFIISDTSGMIPLAANATGIFGTNAYVYVYVPDALLATYQADTYWATLGTRLKGLSELPS